MALTSNFYEAVNAGNVRRVRIMMKDSILVDPTFREFKEMENATSTMRGLYDLHDGSPFELNQDKWDDKYMDKQIVQIVSNFSKERIIHLKNIVRYLRPVTSTLNATKTSKSKHNNTDNMNNSYEEQKRRDQQEGRYLGSKVVTGTIAGAVVGGAIASAAGVTVVGGAVVGAVVGVTTVSIVMNGGR